MDVAIVCAELVNHDRDPVGECEEGVTPTDPSKTSSATVANAPGSSPSTRRRDPVATLGWPGCFLFPHRNVVHSRLSLPYARSRFTHIAYDLTQTAQDLG